jgi:hypothetical protein
LSASYAVALLITLAIEVPVVWWMLRARGWRRVLPAALVANLLSHPALHFLLPRLLPARPLGTFILVGELSVFLWEAVLYLLWIRPRPWPRAVAAAAAANAASFALGLLVFPPPS